MAKFEIISVGSNGQYTVKEHLDIAGVSDRITLLTAQNVDLAASNVDLQSQVDALMSEIDAVIVSIEGYLLADPPDLSSAQKLIEYSNTLSTQAGKYNRVIASNAITITANTKTIAALNALLDQQDVVQDAVCTDGDDTLTVGQMVGSIELDRYPAAKSGGQKVIIRPGASATWVGDRDGIVRPARVMGPSELFVNQALMPSAQIYLPRYVAAVVDALDTDLDTADVSVYASSNNHPATWWEGATPVRLPAALLTGIPVDYLTCNASAFEVGDHVVVEYVNEQPKVIGFIDNPKLCGGFMAVVAPLDGVSLNTIYCNAAFSVDWGDGTFIDYLAGSHSSVATGTITVQSAACTTFQFQSDTFSAITITDASSITSMYRSFRDLTELTSFACSASLSGVTTINGCWDGCINLAAFPAIDFVSVTNAGSAWRDCSSLTSFPLIDLSAATSISSAWNGCSGLTSFPSIDFMSVTNAGFAWRDCSSLTSFPLIDLSEASSISTAWRGCSGLTSFPAINFAACTDMTHAWYGCSALTSFPTIDTSIVTDFSYAWIDCIGLTGFPSLDFGSALTIASAWEGCSGLTSFPEIDTSLVTDFNRAWFNCSGLTTFPSLTVSAGVNFQLTWSNCSGLTSFPALTFTAATNLDRTWNGCAGLTSFPSTDFPVGNLFSSTWSLCSNLVSVGALGTSAGTSFLQTFQNNSSMFTISAIDTTNTSGVSSLMFSGCASLISPDASEQLLLASINGYDFN